MNVHEAKFILKSFRPDGADAEAPEFAEALRVAAMDRELGEWLAVERAEDARFSQALAQAALPADLLEMISGCLAAERGEEPERDELDRTFAMALAGLAPPGGLREEILVVMRESAPRRFGRRLAIPLAAAAGIVLAIVMTRPDSAPGAAPISAQGGTVPVASGVVASQVVPVAHVEAAAIGALSSPDFTLDLKNPDQQALFRFIRENGRPCPAPCVPKGLREVPGIGCRNLVVDGKRGALICFRRGENDIVHLVIFRESDVACEDGGDGVPRIEQHGEWAVARWSEKGRVLLLMGNTDTQRLSELF